MAERPEDPMPKPNRIGSYPVELLDARHTAQVRAHFQSLTGADLRQLFDDGVAARGVEREMAGLTGAEREVYGVIGPDGEVLALLHLTTTGLTASLKVSVAPQARRQGIGFGLVELAKRIAAERGVPWLTALALPTNVPMRKLAQLAGMHVDVNDRRMFAYLKVLQPARRARHLAAADASAGSRPPA